LDILVVFAVNAKIEGNTRLKGNNLAEVVRNLCRALDRQCGGILKSIPAGADLLAIDPRFGRFAELLSAATTIDGIGVATATKVLHRKRRNYIPMLDSIIQNYYAGRDITRDAKAARFKTSLKVVEKFRADLGQAIDALGQFQKHAAAAGFALEPVRILEILI
jgi:Family of unknown function (DUF6308)